MKLLETAVEDIMNSVETKDVKRMSQCDQWVSPADHIKDSSGIVNQHLSFRVARSS